MAKATSQQVVTSKVWYTEVTYRTTDDDGTTAEDETVLFGRHTRKQAERALAEEIGAPVEVTHVRYHWDRMTLDRMTFAELGDVIETSD